MHAPTRPPADYDWLLDWTDWVTRNDHRLEAVFVLDTFLQRSRATEATWALDFLSWKCERLASDGCWYEARLEHLHDRSHVRVLLDR
ncbi:hypothetical protein [Luteimonas sp. 3794]|uniref:hypothetical protein n=1 Tax=Luteimonas sp. 3794 TaxID=2817730 RepID=UPI0028580C74|nr:hypothetical protein [Luteimonas sp. 3794]MDR6990137.1 hypothetical protein [Luteimonas sp. 3794]